MSGARGRLARQVAAVVAIEPRTLGEALAQTAAVAATWSRMSAHGRRVVRAASERLVGLIERRTDRQTGQALGVYSIESGMVDVGCVAEGYRYTVVCEEHGALVCQVSLRDARATRCLDFCDDCREARS